MAVNNIINEVRSPPRPSVFVDLSTTLNRLGQKSTVIMRAECKIAALLLKEPNILPVPIAFFAGRIYALDLSDAASLVDPPSPNEGSIAEINVVRRRLVPPTETHVSKGAPKPSPLRGLVRLGLRPIFRCLFAITPESIHGNLDAILIHIREIIKKLFLPSKSMSPPEIHGSAPSRPPDGPTPELKRDAILNRGVETGWPERGDLLWTCGYIESIEPLRLAAEMHERLGFSSAAICYDAFGKRNKEQNGQPTDHLSSECLTVDLLDFADHILCVSERTRSDLLAVASKNDRSGLDAIVIALGSEPPATALETVLPPELIGRRFALSIGPIETSTNIGMLVRVWNALASNPKFNLDLVVVGRAEESDADLVREVDGSPLLGRRIFWFDECSDDVLGLLYRRADAILNPSLTDGWGIVVTNALTLGTPVVMSNAGTIPLTLLEPATIVDPGDEMAWRSAILTLGTTTRATVQPIEQPTWDVAAQIIVSHIVDIACKQPV